MERVRLEGAKKEFVENEPENPHINYFRNPVSGVLELERLMESVDEKLPDIQNTGTCGSISGRSGGETQRISSGIQPYWIRR